MITGKTQTIDISREELRRITDEYRYDPEEEFWDLDSDDRVWKVKKAMSKLDISDYIIYCLYLELQSERKLAALLGMSRTPIHKYLVKVKTQIINYIENDIN